MASEEKKLFVQELTKSIRDYPLVGIVNLQSLPAQQLQKMRALLLKNEIKLVMARKKLLELALQESGKENIQQLKDKIKGMPALLFSKSNPFALYKIIQKNKSPASAKVGQAAPRDIIVKAGPTNFAPGPIISELAAVGIKTKVEAGKLAIISDAVIVKEGEPISAKVAETLKRLDIKPMEVGLSLVAAWENGLVFEAQQLHIDEAEYLDKITAAAQWAMNLAMEAAYATAETIEGLLQKAFREAKALALEQNMIIDLTAEEVIGKVERQAAALMGTVMGTAQLPEKKVNTNDNNLNNPENDEPKEEVKSNLPISSSSEYFDNAANPEDRELKSNTAEKAKESTDRPPAASKETPEFPTAQDLIKETLKKKFDKDNATIRAERITAQQLSAEKLVEEELKIAEQEQAEKKVKNKKDASIKEAEELYQKLKKTGTLRK